MEVEVKMEDLTAPHHVEKRKNKRRDRRKTNSSENSPTNPFKVEPCEEGEEEQQEVSGPENLNQKPRVVVPSPPGILFFLTCLPPDISLMHCIDNQLLQTFHWTIVKYFSLLERMIVLCI